MYSVFNKQDLTSWAALAVYGVMALLAGCDVAVAPTVGDSSSISAKHDTEAMAIDRSVSALEWTIADVHQAMREDRITAAQLTAYYLERIATLDQSTGLNAIVVTNPKALEQAHQLDAEFAVTGELKPLHGIPIIVKDNYDTAGLQTTGGSIALAGVTPPDDAFQVARLKAAGAIVLAKSNMAEWAFSPSATMSSIAGETRNPYDLTRVPAGSSGGTAAAIAANFGMVGLGTDTGNSIRGPSSHNALVGIRSTMGLTSRDGIIPLYLRNDIGGPMARTVEDAARVLAVIAGPDPADPITLKSAGYQGDAYLRALDSGALQGARIGVLRFYTEQAAIDPEVAVLFEAALDTLRAQGATLVDPLTIDNYAHLITDNWCNTFVADINNYLASLGDNAPYSTIEAIYAANLYGPEVAGALRSMIAAANEPRDCGDLFTNTRNQIFRKQVLETMHANTVDALIYPTWSFPPRKLDRPEDHRGDNSQHIAPHTGLPVITVPMGFTRDNRLPAGLSFLGPLFSEARLIGLSYAFEQASQHRHPPALFGLP